jgi:phosphatidylglycerophosphatase A
MSQPAEAPGSRPGLRIRIATLFGLGHFPISGTVGSAATLPLAVLLAWVGTWAFLVGTLGAVLVALWSAHAAEAHFALKDPHAVVIDEVAGQLVALAFVPLAVGWYMMGFFLFRLFDVVKPFPARRLELVPGGPGIVLDDLVAGLYANLVLQIVRIAHPGPWGSGAVGRLFADVLCGRFDEVAGALDSCRSGVSACLFGGLHSDLVPTVLHVAHRLGGLA